MELRRIRRAMLATATAGVLATSMVVGTGVGASRGGAGGGTFTVTCT